MTGDKPANDKPLQKTSGNDSQSGSNDSKSNSNESISSDDHIKLNSNDNQSSGHWNENNKKNRN